MSYIGYRPWVAKEGLKGFFDACSEEWGNPNKTSHGWPQAILEAICERGPELKLRFDPNCVAGSYFILA